MIFFLFGNIRKKRFSTTLTIITLILNVLMTLIKKHFFSGSSGFTVRKSFNHRLSVGNNEKLVKIPSKARLGEGARRVRRTAGDFWVGD